MYEKSELENCLTDLANFFFFRCVCYCQNKVCMKDTFWKIHWKSRKFATVLLRVVTLKSGLKFILI